MGWETHGSLQARRSHIRRAGALRMMSDDPESIPRA